MGSPPIYHGKLVWCHPCVTSWVGPLSPHLSHQTPSRTCARPAWPWTARPSGASASWECSLRSHTFLQDLIVTARAQQNCRLAATTDPDKPCVKSLTKRKYHTPSGSFWCGHNVVQHHDLLPQCSSFLLLKDYILLLCCTVLWSKQKWCKWITSSAIVSH